MPRGFSFVQHKCLIILSGFLVLIITAGLSGCGSSPTPPEVIVPIVICTPDSPLVNVYRATPQPWASAIFNNAFPLFPTPIPPNPPIQFNEQLILDARYTAFLQLIKETSRWSDTQMITLNDLSEVRITLTYLSPELLQAVFLNQVLKDRSITYGFQDELQKVLGLVADRNELLFLLAVTTKNNSISPIRHSIEIPVEGMVMHNAENLTITHSHDDHNLEQIIDTFSDPVFGYLAYPFAQVSANGCKWILEPKFNTNIVLTVPYIGVDGVQSKKPYFWTIPYAPLLYLSTPSSTPIYPLPLGYDQNQMTPSALPPRDINQPNYWQEFSRFVWNQVTLGNY
jgi:hypothetical protein